MSLETNELVVGDEETRWTLEKKLCSAKGGTRLMMKANMFGDRDEVIRLAKETFAFYLLKSAVGLLFDGQPCCNLAFTGTTETIDEVASRK